MFWTLFATAMFLYLAVMAARRKEEGQLPDSIWPVLILILAVLIFVSTYLLALLAVTALLLGWICSKQVKTMWFRFFGSW